MGRLGSERRNRLGCCLGLAGSNSNTNSDAYADKVVFDFGTVTNVGDNAVNAADKITS